MGNQQVNLEQRKLQRLSARKLLARQWRVSVKTDKDIVYALVKTKGFINQFDVANRIKYYRKNILILSKVKLTNSTTPSKHCG